MIRYLSLKLYYYCQRQREEQHFVLANENQRESFRTKQNVNT